MIDELFLLKAVQIRKDYLNLRKKIDGLEKNLIGLPSILENHQNTLNQIQDRVDKGLLVDKENFSLEILKIFDDLEAETTMYEKKAQDIQDKMDKLQQDEEELFLKIKNNYPDLPLSVIKEEVNKYLKKQNLL